MHVISVISTKGGEGKSTHAANISGFCADAGLKTLLIDGDYAQPTASSYYSLRYEAPCGHSLGLPAHRLEYHTERKSPAAAQTMHSLVCELFPEWAERFDAVLTSQPKGEQE